MGNPIQLAILYLDFGLSSHDHRNFPRLGSSEIGSLVPYFSTDLHPFFSIWLQLRQSGPKRFLELLQSKLVKPVQNQFWRPPFVKH
jgi:hypothetical protein